MMRFARLICVLSGSAVLIIGCSKKETESQPEGADSKANFPIIEQPPRSPGGAPTYGKPSGMGFTTGDAAHSDGAGSGLMGFHGTGQMGTSGAITDRHNFQLPNTPTTDPVLPAQ